MKQLKFCNQLRNTVFKKIPLHLYNKESYMLNHIETTVNWHIKTQIKCHHLNKKKTIIYL